MSLRDAYRRGCEGGAVVGDLGLVSTPAAQAARLAQVKAAAASLATLASQYVPPAERGAQWAAFARAYTDWLRTLEAFAPDWSDRLWGATANQIELYALQLEQWRAELAKWPGSVSLAAAQTEERARMPAERAMSPLGLVLTGLAIGGSIASIVALWRR